MIIINFGPKIEILKASGIGDKNLEFLANLDPGMDIITELMFRLYQRRDGDSGKISELGKLSKTIWKVLQISYENGAYETEPVIKILKTAYRRRIAEPDIMHTVTAYIAHSAHQEYKKIGYNSAPDEFIGVSGAALTNLFLQKNIKTCFHPTKIIAIMQ
ncbi:MAG: hypothetical protein AB7T22_15365 [Calditrichaceae bacterium]